MHAAVWCTHKGLGGRELQYVGVPPVTELVSKNRVNMFFSLPLSANVRGRYVLTPFYMTSSTVAAEGFCNYISIASLERVSICFHGFLNIFKCDKFLEYGDLSGWSGFLKTV